MAEPTIAGRRMRPHNFCESSFGFRRWSAVLEEGQLLDDCKSETFWAHVAARVMGHDLTKPLGRGDIVEVRSFDNSTYAEFIVMAVSPGGLRVRMLRLDQIVEAAAAAAGPLAPKWNFGRKMFDVIRQSDRTVISSGYQTKADALAWIESTLKQAA